jgi:hypothetical protein
MGILRQISLDQSLCHRAVGELVGVTRGNGKVFDK